VIRDYSVAGNMKLLAVAVVVAFLSTAFAQEELKCGKLNELGITDI